MKKGPWWSKVLVFGLAELARRWLAQPGQRTGCALIS